MTTMTAGMLLPLIVNSYVLFSMNMQNPGNPGARGAEEGDYPQWFLKGRMAQAPVKPDPILVTESMKFKVENHGVFVCASAHSSATSFLDGAQIDF